MSRPPQEAGTPPRLFGRIAAWLRALPIADDQERRTAVAVQVFCLGLAAVIAVTETVAAATRVRDYASFTVLFGIGASGASLATCIWAIAMLRRGRPAAAYRGILTVFAAALVSSLALRGVAYHEYFFVRTYVVLLVLAALLLGRVALWTTMGALLVGIGLGYLHDHVWSVPLPPPEPAGGSIARAVPVALLLCVLVDRFGAALRAGYLASRKREAELGEALRDLRAEAARRSHAEALLFESQKIEALGRLSSGVAHDFNNVLTAIGGFVELARRTVPASHPAQADLQQAIDAMQRAAELTRRLLAFARKQIAEPRVLDVEAQVRAILPLVERLLREGVTIETRFQPEPLLVRMDPTLLAQVLLNLAANASDAMPRGGLVRIAADGIRDPQGEWVELEVADTGTGIDEETARHLFEPFFTTKAEGKGTGLGLATCQGIVHQAGGSIAVESVVGRGSTFRVRLPRVRGTADPAHAEPAGRGPQRVRTERVLVVEDDPQIRSLVAAWLGSVGYRVDTAPDAGAARALVSRDAVAPDLLITDVVMPGGDGRQLAEHLQATHPSLRVLYISGYTHEIIGKHGVLEPDVALLQKPFTLAALLARVDGAFEGTRS